MTPREALEMGPLQLAYLGDAIYDLVVRSELLLSGRKLSLVHREATTLVRAAAQAEALRRIQPYLTDEECDIVRKGRNAHARHPAPRSATCAEYAASTGFEAMLGFLYLTGQQERIRELFLLSRS